ncbi:MAG: hypothetical protein GXP32_00665 [Kiritimatiellaeota bacterium]|nr:hypothetical protein [Kiritimatiellota bacterium]
MKDDKRESGDDLHCPSREALSAYFDGEAPDASSIAEHLDECPECSERLKYFAGLAADLKSEFQKRSDETFTRNLPNVLRRKIRKNASARSTPFPLFLKVAAMFAAAAVVIISLISENPNDEPSVSPPSKSIDPIVFLGDGLEPDKGRLTFLPVPSDTTLFESPPINASDLTPVATARHTDSRASSFPTKNAPAENPESITRSVRQTWSVANLESAIVKFKKAVPVKAKLSERRDGGGNLILNVVLTKKELAELVRKCADAGFDLLSPAQPQPEQRIFRGDSTSKVSYTAVLVPK